MKLRIGFLNLVANTAIFISGHTQSLEVDVRYNNINDINLAKIQEYKAQFNTTSITSALNTNNHITDKNLKIDIVFFDRLMVGELKLISEHELSSADYISRWRQYFNNQSRILFLFSKRHPDEKYGLDSLIFSNQLQEEYFLSSIVDFIRMKLIGDQLEIIRLGAKMLEKSLNPIWNEQKIQAARNLVSQKKYLSRHVNSFHGWFRFGYFDFLPATKESTKNMNLVNAWTGTDANNSDWFFSKKYFFTSDEKLAGFNTKNVYDWGITFEKENINSIYIFKDAFLFSLLKYVEGLNKHNPTSNASSWDWIYDSDATPSRYLRSADAFRARDSTDRMIVFFNDGSSLADGDPIPVLSASHANTWCNIFQCDLSNEVLFGNIFGDIHNGPWGANQSANALHYRICNDKINFKEVSLINAKKYAAKGFVVFFSSFHRTKDPNLIYTAQKETDVAGGRSGHINICFPANMENSQENSFGSIIQAGTSTGVMLYSSAWGSSYEGKVKAHIYLGHLK